MQQALSGAAPKRCVCVCVCVRNADTVSTNRIAHSVHLQVSKEWGFQSDATVKLVLERAKRFSKQKARGKWPA